MNSDKVYEIKDNGDVVVFLNEDESNQFIPITQLQGTGNDFFEKLKVKIEQENDIRKKSCCL